MGKVELCRCDANDAAQTQGPATAATDAAAAAAAAAAASRTNGAGLTQRNGHGGSDGQTNDQTNGTAGEDDLCESRSRGSSDSSIPSTVTMVASVGREERKAIIAKAMKTILSCLDDDPSREGLEKTPVRYAEALLGFTQGYAADPAAELSGAEFDENHHEMVLIRNIDIYSHCEHHMIPFVGRCHIGYIPNGRVVGLSKLARVADIFSQRLQVQERLTTQIAEAVFSELRPRGVGVYIEATHMCMVMRGVRKASACTTTTAMLGSFNNDRDVRREFLDLVRMGGR